MTKNKGEEERNSPCTPSESDDGDFSDTDVDDRSNSLEEIRREYEAYMNSKHKTRDKQAWTYEMCREGRNDSKPFLVSFKVDEKHITKDLEEECEDGTTDDPQAEPEDEEEATYESKINEEGDDRNEPEDCSLNRSTSSAVAVTNDSKENKEASEEKKEEERICLPPTKKFCMASETIKKIELKHNIN